MATEIGTIGNKTYYSDVRWGVFLQKGLCIEVTTYDHSRPLVFIEELGTVKNQDEADDKVIALVKREREKIAVRDASKGGNNE